MRECVITPYGDGPYLVRGSFKLVDQNGNEIETHRRTIALCRCGKSRLGPMCDGTHKAIGFKSPRPSRMSAADGAAACDESSPRVE